MNLFTPSWPVTGRSLQILRALLLTAFAFVLNGVGLTHANEPPPTTTLARLRSESVEQRILRAENAVGTVVIENGLRADLKGWSQVIDGLETRPTPTRQTKAWSIFAYNRPGIGRSEPTVRPRNGRQIVTDLHELLQQEGLKPPYLLVGHSLGGLYVQLFARTYPDEIQGLILVDSLYPGVIKKTAEFPFYARWCKALFLSNMATGEIDGIYETGEDVLALPWMLHIPVTRLINLPKSADAIAVDFGVIRDDAATISRVRAMYPGAKTIVVDSDHQMQKANPEVIVRAIQDMMNP